MNPAGGLGLRMRVQPPSLGGLGLAFETWESYNLSAATDHSR